ncbi:adenine-specific DNA-methyltransferase [Novimethylophilus kurashikiensis]|uniref:site-specific DNA-methyltransferase (adenine-specific) n=1 Tax=Novimethylophilus kurashikiensis TaxID=1825523 RepID=A0A2R5F7L6_9PROT|nr:site-specific DNA-methyltransferase [Novimethylophilus kurashikiensis]GBG14232.1 adenine-specific DNA-methyltransferase [Novimethylophilus kurashikiensis]
MEILTHQDPETQSADIVAGNIAQIKALFPELITESADGTTVNIDILKQLVGDKTVTDVEEKYGLNWHGKRRARQLALTPSTGTLRPSPEDSVDWDTTQNLMIEGDNLEVLKLLQKSYAGKVKLIYIDPPYNTGKDFVYPDNFQDNIKNYLELTGQIEGGQKISSNTEASGRFHTDWLNMMYPRLKLARNLLRDDGVIFISIDDNEDSNLRKLCDEIFGEENFIAQLVWKKKYTGGQHAKFYADFHEYILVYAKFADAIGDFGIARTDEESEKFIESDEFEKVRGKYYTRPLKSNLEERKTLIYPITMPDGNVLTTQWLVSKERFEREFAEKRIVFRQKNNGEWQVYKKYYQLDGGGKTKPPSLIDRFPNTEAKSELKELFDVQEGRDNVFYTVKPIKLIRHLLEPFLGSDDICLDFFAGSGTTGQVIYEMNSSDKGKRRFILVQLPEPLDNNLNTIAELTKERLRRATTKIKSENPGWNGDLGFRIFKLDSSNIRSWEADRENLANSLFDATEHLKSDRTEQDILFELLLKLGLDLTVPMETKVIAGMNVYSIGAGALIVCLVDKIASSDVEALSTGIVAWHVELSPVVDTQLVFRDSAFADDAAKANCTAILQQHGLVNVRSL